MPLCHLAKEGVNKQHTRAKSFRIANCKKTHFLIWISSPLGILEHNHQTAPFFLTSFGSILNQKGIKNNASTYCEQKLSSDNKRFALSFPINLHWFSSSSPVSSKHRWTKHKNQTDLHMSLWLHKSPHDTKGTQQFTCKRPNMASYSEVPFQQSYRFSFYALAKQIIWDSLSMLMFQRSQIFP